jgi:hypothetical protein
MKRRTFYILLAFIVANVLVLVAGLYWRAQKKVVVDEMVQRAERYPGATGDSITAFDNRTDRWIAEMKEEPIEVILQKLTDAAEYIESMFQFDSVGLAIYSDEVRDQTIYSKDIRSLLANRRFRKAYEDLQKIDKAQAAALLAKNIRENLPELRVMLKGYKDMITRGRHKGNIAVTTVNPDVDSYRYASRSDVPPTRFGRRHAVLSYILLASLLELQEVRPAIEDVIAFAKEEYKLFNSVSDEEAGTFKLVVLKESLYNPSLLLTATLCDPAWNADKHKLLGETPYDPVSADFRALFPDIPKSTETKLAEFEIVDWQARAMEFDMPGREGWVPVKPHEKMLKVRYYRGITDAEFNDFFGK